MTGRGEHGWIQAQTGDITVANGAPTLYRAQHKFEIGRGGYEPRRVGDYYELGPEAAPVMTIELERGSIKAY